MSRAIVYNNCMVKLPEYVVKFLKTFKKNGFLIYVVGGSVRDLLLGKETKNWDFTTNAKPEEIMKLFPDAFYNNQFGTVGIPIPTQERQLVFEVTTFRKESNYTDNRHPETIEWAQTVEEDLARRDFTINAIALRLVSLAQGASSYEIVDPYDGQKHLKEKLIIAVGDPDRRFQEDALRLIRAIRLAAQLEFLIEEKTRASIQKNAHLILNISAERIRDELLKILGTNHPSEGILFMRQTGLLQRILPELDDCFDIPQKSPKRHHIYDVGTHLIMSLKHCPSSDVITRFAALLHDVGKLKTFKKDEKTQLITFYNHEVAGTTMATRIADRLKLSGKQKEKLIRLVQYHQFTVSELQTDKTLRRFIREVGKEYLQDLLDVRIGDRIGSGAAPTSWRFELFKKRLDEVQKIPFMVKDLKIDGHDVMKILHIKPGPKIGELLQTIFNDVEEGKLQNERDVLLKRIEELLQG